MSISAQNNPVELRVADLLLILEGYSDNLIFSLPRVLQNFVNTKSDSSSLFLEPTTSLHLTVKNQLPPKTPIDTEKIVETKTFNVYRTGLGELTFFLPMQLPQRTITINANFDQGDIYGEFSKYNKAPFYPLEHYDILIYSNWLAKLGDLILHASGAAINGLGFCFCGRSGIGKSTLAANLANKPGVTILGEDQVILRHRQNGFQIFGTPWHTDPERCSPVGVPLSRIFLLSRLNAESVKLLSPDEGIKRLMPSAFVPYYQTQWLDGILNNLEQLSLRIPIYELSYKLESDILPLLQNEIS